MCVSTEHLPWHVQCQPIYQISSVIRLRTRVTIGGTPLFQLGASLHGQGHNTPAQPRFQACVTITRPTMHRCMRVVMGVLGPTQNRCTRGVCPNRSRGPLLTIREHDIRILQLWLQTSMHMSAIARLTLRLARARAAACRYRHPCRGMIPRSPSIACQSDAHGLDELMCAHGHGLMCGDASTAQASASTCYMALMLLLLLLMGCMQCRTIAHPLISPRTKRLPRAPRWRASLTVRATLYV